LRAETIEEVVARLTTIIEQAKAESSRLGYFPALYRRVTLDVKQRIEGGFFDDAARTERLDVVFANRYLEAYARYRDGEPPTASWRSCFDATDEWWPIVLEHLLLGMNAHINLDLGIAAVETMEGSDLSALQDDFDRVNGVLEELTDTVYGQMQAVWPVLRILGGSLGSVETAILRFSMKTARDGAWRFAERLAEVEAGARAAPIAARDRDVLGVAKLIRRKNAVTGTVPRLIRLGELQSVRGVIEILE